MSDFDREPSFDDDEVDLRQLFVARAKRDARDSRSAFELDLDDVIARAHQQSVAPAASESDEPARRSPRGGLPSPVVARMSALRERNGAFVSGVTALAAAACFWLSFNAGLERAEPPSLSGSTDPGPIGALVCGGRRAMGRELCVDTEVPSRQTSAMSAPLSSTDLGVSDDRAVTCMAFGP